MCNGNAFRDACQATARLPHAMARLAVILLAEARAALRISYRAALAPVLASAWEGNTMLKSALLIGAGIVVGAGAIQGMHAAGGPTVLTTYEANIKDEAGYTAALPEVEKYIKDNGGQRLAGGSAS
jgi:hypothetical protein